MNENNRELIIVLGSVAFAILGLIIGTAIDPIHTTCSCSQQTTLGGLFGLAGFVGGAFLISHITRKETRGAG